MKVNVATLVFSFILGSLSAICSAQELPAQPGASPGLQAVEEGDWIFVSPFECPAHSASVTLRRYDQSFFTGGMGAPWGALINFDRVFYAGNVPVQTTPAQPPNQFRVRAWEFEAPTQALTGWLVLPPSGNHVTVISACPADFDVPPECRGNGGNSRLKWSTRPDEAGACLLEPGRTYYLQGAHFSLAGYVSSGDVLNTCGCANPPCTLCPLSMSSTQAY